MNDFNEEAAVKLSGQILKLIRESGVSDTEGLAALKAAESIVSQKAIRQTILDAYLSGYKGTKQ